MKYGNLLITLEDDVLYSPGSIARHANKFGYVTDYDQKNRKNSLLRIRIAMARFSNNHAFPDEGDGLLEIPGQAATPAWFGWRWKQAVKKKKE